MGTPAEQRIAGSARFVCGMLFLLFIGDDAERKNISTIAAYEDMFCSSFAIHTGVSRELNETWNRFSCHSVVKK